MKLAPTIILLASCLFPLAATAEARPASAGETPASFLAQITTDGTTSTTVNPTNTGVQIDNGNRAGGNLFHSFDEFSIPNKTEAFFNNPNDIVNIFSRVTGGNVSNIDGLIRANGTANLFLINPAGIVFGNEARLQLGGSFYGSTADSIIFSNGEFSATNLDNPPLITINAPIGLNFRDNPQPIFNRSVTEENLGLQINAGQAINLIGGDINFEGGRITAQGAAVWLGGVAEAEIVSLDRNLNPNISDEVSRANISFSANEITSEISRINVASDGGGSITVIGNEITLNQASQLFGGMAENLGTAESQAGDINLDAIGAIVLNEESRIENRVNSGAIGSSGNINVTAQSLTLRDGSRLSASTFGRGNAGEIQVETTGTVELDGVADSGQRSRIASGIASRGEGEGGNIIINAGSLFLTNGALLNTRSAGVGNAGNIIINAENGAITVAGFGSAQNGELRFSSIENNLDSDAIGSAGNIEITTANLNLTNGGRVDANTFGRGNGGKITLNVSNNVAMDGGLESLITGIFSAVGDTGVGSAEGVEITTANLTLTNGGKVNASTFGTGNAGGVTIEASETITLDGQDANGFGSGIFSNVESGAVGNAEGVDITTHNLILTNGSDISASAFGQGNAGQVKIKASDTVTVSGFIIQENGSLSPSAIRTEVGFKSEEQARENFQGGDIEIGAKNLALDDFGVISALTSGIGNAGNISIDVNDSIVLTSSSSLLASSERGARGNAGNITVTTDVFRLVDGAEVNSLTANEGRGGNITVSANIFEATGGGQVLTTTLDRGNAGIIRLNIVDDISISGSGIFANTASDSTGDGGNITIGVFQQQENDLVLDETQFTSEITLADESIIAADSEGDGAGGSIILRGGEVSLNQGQISATTESTISLEERDNLPLSEIKLFVDANLTLRNNSTISTEAGNNTNAGNINVEAEFILATPNEGNGNDIIASAEEGQGGDIAITTESLLGIEERTAEKNNGTNDIDASSQVEGLEGTVSIETPDNNPLRETTELSDNIVSPGIVTANACEVTATRGVTSILIVKGKGSVLVEPSQPFTADALIIEGELSTSNLFYDNNYVGIFNKTSLEQEETEKPYLEPNQIPSEVQPVAYKNNGEPIYLARGVIKQEDGTVVLTAFPQGNIMPRTPQNPYGCS